MNKLVKGSIAGAAGVALLLGGAGTFAVWNDTVQLTAPSIRAGHLQLSAAGTGKWMNGATQFNPATDRIIPGMTLTYTETLTVDADGTGISAELTHSPLVENASGLLAPEVTSTLQILQNGTPDADGKITFAKGTSTVDAKITVVFPGLQTVQGGQTEQLVLNDVVFTLTQKI